MIDTLTPFTHYPFKIKAYSVSGAGADLGAKQAGTILVSSLSDSLSCKITPSPNNVCVLSSLDCFLYFFKKRLFMCLV